MVTLPPPPPHRHIRTRLACKTPSIFLCFTCSPRARSLVCGSRSIRFNAGETTVSDKEKNFLPHHYFIAHRRSPCLFTTSVAVVVVVVAMNVARPPTVWRSAPFATIAAAAATSVARPPIAWLSVRNATHVVFVGRATTRASRARIARWRARVQWQRPQPQRLPIALPVQAEDATSVDRTSIAWPPAPSAMVAEQQEPLRLPHPPMCALRANARATLRASAPTRVRCPGCRPTSSSTHGCCS
jgi:hypothetical protein